MKTYIVPIILLIISNAFMTFAWYGHLKFEEWGIFKKTGLFSVILISWGLALFEYIFQVPANRIGYVENGGGYQLFELKVMQEVISLVVFFIFSLVFFKNISFTWNHFYASICLILAVYFVFKK